MPEPQRRRTAGEWQAEVDRLLQRHNRLMGQWMRADHEAAVATDRNDGRALGSLRDWQRELDRRMTALEDAIAEATAEIDRAVLDPDRPLLEG